MKRATTSQHLVGMPTFTQFSQTCQRGVSDDVGPFPPRCPKTTHIETKALLRQCKFTVQPLWQQPNKTSVRVFHPICYAQLSAQQKHFQNKRGMDIAPTHLLLHVLREVRQPKRTQTRTHWWSDSSAEAATLRSPLQLLAQHDSQPERRYLAAVSHPKGSGFLRGLHQKLKPKCQKSY